MASQNMSVGEIATEAGITEQSVRRYIHDGSLPYTKDGRNYVIRRVDAAARVNGVSRSSTSWASA